MIKKKTREEQVSRIIGTTVPAMQTCSPLHTKIVLYLIIAIKLFDLNERRRNKLMLAPKRAWRKQDYDET